MIALVHLDGGHTKYVPLQLDPGGSKVWVPISTQHLLPDAVDEESRLQALLLCVRTLQTNHGSLQADARKLCGLTALPSPTDEQRAELHSVAVYLADSLDREGQNLLRVIEQPTSDDQVELDVEYDIVDDPTDASTPRQML